MLCRRVYEGILLGGSEKCAVKQIEIPIVYNKYGGHDPNGLLYVLKKDAARIRKEAFSHSLNRALSIHVQGLRYEVQTSDGASVGCNRDSTTKIRSYIHGMQIKKVYILFRIWGIPEAVKKERMYTVCLVQSSLSRLEQCGIEVFLWQKHCMRKKLWLLHREQNVSVNV